MTAKVVQFQQIGPVKFVKSRRSKSIKISVKPDQSVRVSFPPFVTSGEVMDFVMKNNSWITGQQQKFERQKPVFDLNSTIRTKLHRVAFSNGPRLQTRIQEREVTIELPGDDPVLAQKYTEEVLVSIYRYEAKVLLPPRVRALAAKHGFRYGRITVRNNKRSWGSCSSQNNLSLNLQMMKLPDHLIDYILLHELVHTQIKNHGPQFWHKLNQLTHNQARKLAAEVRNYSTYTL